MDRQQGKPGPLQGNSAEHERPEERESKPEPITKDNNISTEESLLEQILDRNNLNDAFRRVRDNGGAPGIDGMNVDEELLEYLKENKDLFIEQIRNRKYKPSPVRRVYIPKDFSIEKRPLGIPTGTDRVFQQAIANILEEIYDPTFSDNSFGFRPNRGTHKALWRIQKFVDQGFKYAVCLDIEKFFDTVNHSKLIQVLSEQVDDGDVISLIHKFLKAGVVDKGNFVKSTQGMPQGGPLSPILSNILLDKLDKELERRGHKFVRYADDCLILCKSRNAALRTMQSIIKFIEKKLHLKVNKDKSKVCHINDVKYLGYGFYIYDGKCKFRVHPKSVKKFKDKVRQLTKRNSALSYEQTQKSLNKFIKGWMGYFYLANNISLFTKLDAWIRRRIRQLFWKRWKRPRTKYGNLRKLGLKHGDAVRLATSRKGYWCLSKTPQMHRALDNLTLVDIGFTNLLSTYESVRDNARKKIKKLLEAKTGKRFKLVC